MLGAAGFTVRGRVTDTDFVGVLESLTVTVMLPLKATLGVPMTVPLGFMDKPEGSPVALHV
jgi:hypothetical protein